MASELCSTTRRLAAGYFKFRFLDLCIRFGKIISKVCWCFNPAPKKPRAASRSWFFAVYPE
jgi:hypothetical protein